MSDLESARAKFVATFEHRIEGAAHDIFEKGLRMAEAGDPVEDIKAFLAGAVGAGKVATRGDSTQCMAECKSQCAEFPGGPPWYACYAGCFAGCMSA